jgi:hypothetical protein
MGDILNRSSTKAGAKSAMTVLGAASRRATALRSTALRTAPLRKATRRFATQRNDRLSIFAASPLYAPLRNAARRIAARRSSAQLNATIGLSISIAPLLSAPHHVSTPRAALLHRATLRCAPLRPSAHHPATQRRTAPRYSTQRNATIHLSIFLRGSRDPRQ